MLPASEVIELSELRIGNILEYDGKYVHVTTVSRDIDDEYQDTIGFCELDKTTEEIVDWNRSLVDKLKRVALTHVLLENCGFERKVHVDEVKGFNESAVISQHRFSIEVYDCDLELSSSPGSIEKFVDETESAEEFYGAYLINAKQVKLYIKPISFLHELQNLYSSLSGKELNVRL